MIDFLMRNDKKADGSDNLNVSPSPPRSAHQHQHHKQQQQQQQQNSSAADSLNNSSSRRIAVPPITSPRRWTRKTCCADRLLPKERDGFVRLDKEGAVQHVPWNDPPPSVLFQHLKAREDRSCLDYEDVPVFSSFATEGPFAKFSLTRHERPVDIGAPLEEEKEPLANKLHRSHKVLEQAEAAAHDILPPPARQPRLPVPVAEAVDLDALEAASEYPASQSVCFADESALDFSPVAASSSTRNHTRREIQMLIQKQQQQQQQSPEFSLPPSTNLGPSPQRTNSPNNNSTKEDTITPQRKKSHHKNSGGSSSKQQQQQQQHCYQQGVLDVSPPRFPLFSSHGVGAAASEHHMPPVMQSVPRPSHSPRALKQFMSPQQHRSKMASGCWGSISARKADDAVAPGVAATKSGETTPQRPSTARISNTRVNSAAAAAAAASGHLSVANVSSPQRAAMLPGEFPSPARSAAPISVRDLVSIANRPRPQSARMMSTSMALSLSKSSPSKSQHRHAVPTNSNNNNNNNNIFVAAGSQ